MYIGIDIGGTDIKAGLVDKNCNIIAKGSIPTPKDSYESTLKSIVSIVNQMASEGGYKLSEIESVGIGCPGWVDAKKGTVKCAHNLAVPEMNLGPDLSERLQLPVYLGNDANCAAWGEFYALEDENIENFVIITLGTGVGGGIVINRKLYTAANGCAGELGHTLLRADGEQCTCGRKGCWEAYASATALIRETEKAARENPGSLLAEIISQNGGRANGKTAFEAAKKGDDAGKRVVDDYIRAVADGIVNVMNTLYPEIVVVGGGVSNAGEDLIKPVREYVQKHSYGTQEGVPCGDVRLAKLGNDAGIVGAALLGLNK